MERSTRQPGRPCCPQAASTSLVLPHPGHQQGFIGADSPKPSLKAATCLSFPTATPPTRSIRIANQLIKNTKIRIAQSSAVAHIQLVEWAQGKEGRSAGTAGTPECMLGSCRTCHVTKGYLTSHGGKFRQRELKHVPRCAESW